MENLPYIHAFEPEFKHRNLIKHEWIHLDKDNHNEFYLVSFRYVNKHNKVINEYKDVLMNHYNLTKNDIISEFNDEAEYGVSDGVFVFTKIKRKKTLLLSNTQKKTIQKNFCNFETISESINDLFFS